MMSGVVKMNLFKSFLLHSTKPLEPLSLCDPLDLAETKIGAEVREESHSSFAQKIQARSLVPCGQKYTHSYLPLEELAGQLLPCLKDLTISCAKAFLDSIKKFLCTRLRRPKRSYSIKVAVPPGYIPG